MTTTHGLFSDVHGNRIALEAVVADGAALGVDRWWALGDLVAIGPSPAATLELIADLPGIAALRGNTERYVLTGDRPPPSAEDVERDPSLADVYAEVSASFAWTRGFLEGAGWLDWVADLPLDLRDTLPDSTRLLAVHASPGRDDGDGIPADGDDTDLAALLAGGDADLVCAGHTHRPVDRRVGDVRAVNLGSVGNPVTADHRASDVVLRADRHGVDAVHRRVAWDTARFLEQVRASSHPGADDIAGFLAD